MNLIVSAQIAPVDKLFKLVSGKAARINKRLEGAQG